MENITYYGYYSPETRHWLIYREFEATKHNSRLSYRVVRLYMDK